VDNTSILFRVTVLRICWSFCEQCCFVVHKTKKEKINYQNRKVRKFLIREN